MRWLWVLLALTGFGGPTLACDGAALGQSLTLRDRAIWFGAGQASPLLPLPWFTALTRADDGTPFASRSSLARYGFRYCDEDAALPMGLVPRAQASGAPDLALACAGCHGGQLTDGKREFAVLGGASGLDTQRFARDMFTALLLARSGAFSDANGATAWQSFANAVLGQDPAPEATAQLHAEVSEWLQAQKAPQASAHAGGAWGFGRMDMQPPVQSDGAKLKPATAPVSVPAVWWGGAPDSPMHPEIGPDTPAIAPPKWPVEWGVIDRATPDYAAGQALYDQHCLTCHARFDRAKDKIADPKLLRIAPLFDAIAPDLPALGTDPMTLCNAATERHDAQDTEKEIESTHALRDLQAVAALCKTALAAAAASGYTAAPLAGVFATAPYLHNGSVPTLDALLLPPEARPSAFAVGAVLFDPVTVGLGPAIADAVAVGAFNAANRKGAPIAGNSNLGHAYPKHPLSAVERAQLILYLKSM